jgi:hypothetical protein
LWLGYRTDNVARKTEQSGRCLFIQRTLMIRDGRENEVIFNLIQGFHGVNPGFQPTGFSDERFQN